MQLKSLYCATAVLASITFQYDRAYAQAVKPESVMGTVTELRVQTRELVITTGDGNTLPVKVSMHTEFLRVPPGVHDLSKAAPASPHDMKAGDHVLVSYADGMMEARRVVFTPAAVDAQNQADWDRRGLSGTVSSKSSNEITAQLPGDAQSTIVITPNTKIRRYAPDSVTLAQAASSTIEEISTGDQIRAHGEKSPNGQTLTADEVVFGTFLTKAGTITAIDSNAHEITIQEVGTNKPVVVKLTAESQLKTLPNMHVPKDSGTSAHESLPQHMPTTPGGAVDIAKLISSMPGCKMDDLEIGGAVLVSSTKGATEDNVTAIMLLANAGTIVQMMQEQAAGDGSGMEHFLMAHGLNPAQGLNLPSILQ